MQQLIEATEQHVRSELASRDASHDYSHIDRVRKMALHLGHKEGLDSDSLFVVELAALLHDIRDWKYAQGGAVWNQRTTKHRDTVVCVLQPSMCKHCTLQLHGHQQVVTLSVPVCHDSVYCSTVIAEGDDAASDAIRSFLLSQQQSEQLIDQVISIVDSVGFKDELGGVSRPLSKEAAVVQDADR